jgi:NADPH:quinone reductase
MTRPVAATWPLGKPVGPNRTMRAVVFGEPGGPEVVHVIDLPVPEVGPAEVLIEVAASPVFSADVAARSGLLGPMLPPAPFHRLGWDLAGTVVSVGSGVEGMAAGDHVIGFSSPMSAKHGTQAEYAVVDALALAPAPKGLSPAEASTIPANGLVAAQALDSLDLPEGGTVAVIGAAGAVGGYILELALIRGLHAIGVASETDRKFVEDRGATFVGRSANAAGAIRSVIPEGVDGLIDGAGLGQSSIGAVRDGGAFVELIPPATPAAVRGVRVQSFMVHPDGIQLRKLSSYAEDGRLTARVAKTFKFEEAAAAHRMYEQARSRGRLVMVP